MKITKTKLAALVLVSFTAGLTIAPAHSNIAGQMAKFRMTFELVAGQFYQPVDREKLMESAVNGLVKKLDDPYSYYMTPSEYAQYQAQQSGEITGIGVELAVKHGEIRIVSVLDGSPADRAGLRSGDTLRKVEGQDTLKLSFAQALNLLSGQVGSQVELHIARPDQREDFTLKITREVLKIAPLNRAMLPGKIGYIKLNSFLNPKTSEEMKSALTQLTQQGLNGMILDLRDNPGGLVNQAQEIGSLFLEKGAIVRIVNRYGRETTLGVMGDPILPANVPMAVLINQGSASASEILAASLKEYQRATLVGETTFGKGLVQEVVPLQNGGGLSLSTSRYLTGKKQDVHGKGIQPDIQIAHSSDREDMQLKAAIDYLNR